MRLYQLTGFVSGINAAIDTGEYNITITEVEDHINKEDLIPWLRERLGDDIDLSIYDQILPEEMNKELKAILTHYVGEEGRKWGVYNNGLCLLIAWAVNLIALKEWED